MYELEGTSMHTPRQERPGSIVLFCSMIAGGLLSLQASAADVSHGEMAGAIRSANYPCAQVLNIDSTGDNAWVVQCNSGKFNVSRDQNGDFQVTQSD
jgi:hypothetical protein